MQANRDNEHVADVMVCHERLPFVVENTERPSSSLTDQLSRGIQSHDHLLYAATSIKYYDLPLGSSYVLQRAHPASVRAESSKITTSTTIFALL